MAVNYLKEIRELQPQGPYYLSGFCMGGAVAYEMAQMLRREGERVGLLAMIDTYNFHGVPPRLSLRERINQKGQKIGFHWTNFARLTVTQQAKYLYAKLTCAAEREVERWIVRVANLMKLTRLGKGRSRKEVFIEHLNEEAAFNYIADIYPDRVTIFKPRRNYDFLRDSEMGWGDAIPQGLEVVSLPVDPGGIFVEPYVETLAKELRTRIDRSTYYNKE
jgi:thioesterase domain-containing protein